MKLGNKVAIVTGAGSGIGRGIALAFAREGAKVSVVDINRAGAEETVAEIRAKGGEAIVIQADVSICSEIERMVDETVQELGALDILVNNAGIDIPGPITVIEEEDFERLIAVNLKSVYFGCKKAILHMLDHGGGTILNISSLAAVCGTTGLSLYSAAKAGIVGLTKSLAIEYAVPKIRVNAICPGWIRTGMSAEYLEGMEDWVVDNTPMGRVGSPEDIAPTAVYLASDDSRFMTGQAIVVDGGFSVV